MLGRQSALCKEDWTRSPSQSAICKTSYSVRSSSRQKCKVFVRPARACRGVAVSQCHSDMSGDMCIPTHIATAMSVSRVGLRIQ